MTGNADIDLTPISNEFELDGVKMSNIAFRDGERRLTYDPPAGWRISGSGKQLTLVPESSANVDGRIDVLPVAGALLPLDDSNAAKYAERAKQMLPRDAKKVEIVGTQLNPLKISGNDTLAVDLKYEAFGTGCRTYILFLNRKRDQWIFRFTAPFDGFDRPFDAFRKSLYSMTGL